MVAAICIMAICQVHSMDEVSSGCLAYCEIGYDREYWIGGHQSDVRTCISSASAIIQLPVHISFVGCYRDGKLCGLL